MEALNQYFLSIVIAAMICGILSAVMPNTNASLIKFIFGFALLLVMLKPLSGFKLNSFQKNYFPIKQSGEAAALDGKMMAQEAIGNIIKQRTEAYILEEAAALNIFVQPEVFMDEDSIPVNVTIAGDISPYAKAHLANYIETTLGIQKEHQEWTG